MSHFCKICQKFNVSNTCLYYIPNYSTMLLNRKIINMIQTSVRKYQVTVVGGASEVGQVACLLLRAQPSITKLIVHDNKEYTPGVLLDLSHIPSPSKIIGEDTLEKALKNSDLIVATSSLTCKPGINKRSWISTNTAFIKSLATEIAKISPMPFVGILSEPMNSLVPMAAEIIKNKGEYDARKLFGITVLNSLRAQSLYASDNNLDTCDCTVPIIGGHSDKTLVPLLSQAKPSMNMNEKCIQELTAKIRKCDYNITKTKKGWSPTLSVAYSILIFAKGILDALDGKPSKINAYIENNDFGTSYFSGLVTVNHLGATEMERYSNLSQFECNLLERSIEQLREDVSKGKRILELS